jgi:hypothetical protein
MSEPSYITLPEGMKPALVIEGEPFFTIKQIQEALKEADGIEVPAHHIKARLRNGVLKGKKLGRVYLISGRSLSEWILSDDKYEPRRRQAVPA